LQTKGITVDGKTVAVLKPPTFSDGMDAAAQQTALKSIPMRLPLDEFVRNSVVAPCALSVGDLTETESGIRIRTLDIWFVAHADLKTLRDNRQLLDEFLHEADGETRRLSAEELGRRGIEVPPEAVERTTYAHAVSTLLDRVRLSVTTHTVYSQSDDSSVLAGEVDQQFVGDAELPNQWQPIEISAQGKVIGSAEPYSASAFYWKATQLAEPAGAILVEYHSAFEQPSGWFGGRDLLRSKVPMAVQNGVRTLRRKLKKAMQ
jgi:hypothetical protein